MKILRFAAFGLLSFSAISFAGQKNTANFVTAAIEQFDGTSASLDVTHLTRINLTLPGKDLAFFSAYTIDDRNQNFGGRILVIADNSGVAELIKKYGTNVEETSRRAASKSLKGTVGRIKTSGMEDIVFINVSSETEPEKLPLKRVSVDAVVNPEKTSN